MAERDAPIRLAWLARLYGRLMAAYLRLVAATSVVSGEVTRDQVVLVFWHEYNLAGIVAALKHRGDLPHASFSTRGFRGLVITTLLERLTLRVLPLPDEGVARTEARALAVRMSRLAADGYTLVVTPDGPFGPYRVAKPGAVIVAREAGLPIQPWTIRATPSLRLTGRWDRHLVPLPFSRLRVTPGRRIRIEKHERLAPMVAELEAEMR
jgi:lysophospholipid acyltransferase (LPLAT)-like uncharacterized protein